MSDMIGPYELDRIITGDARELAKAIPDESVDLIFTDPPYPREFLPLYGWLAETAARVPDMVIDGYVNYVNLSKLIGNPVMPFSHWLAEGDKE